MPAWLVPGPFPAEFMTDERCSITELLNIDESPDASLALARVAPGVATRLHAVTGTTECYVILAGHGVVEVDGTPEAVGPGDRIVIPAGVAQRITATGAAPLEFHCVCTPRFRPANYVDLGDPPPATAPDRRSPR